MQGKNIVLHDTLKGFTIRHGYRVLFLGLFSLAAIAGVVHGLASPYDGLHHWDPFVTGNGVNAAPPETVPGAFIPIASEGYHEAGFSLSTRAYDNILLKGGDVALIPHAAAPALLHGDSVTIRFKGQDRSSLPEPESPYSGKASLFLGDKPSGWRTGIPLYRSVTYKELYPGISLTYSGTAEGMKSEFFVAAAADPGVISYTYEKARTIQVDKNGAVLVETKNNRSFAEAPPEAYQVIDGQEVPVPVTYRIDAGGQIGFSLGTYDPKYPLVIDPEIVASGCLGGSADDVGAAVAVDDAGTVYVAGYTHSHDFFTTGGAFDNAGGGFDDIFVTAYTKDGSDILFATYIGGKVNDYVRSILVDPDGRVIVAGSTECADFPVKNAYQPVIGGKYDAFVAAILPGGNELAFSTYLGGSDIDDAFGAALGKEKNTIFLTGMTQSKDFPVVDAFQEENAGQVDAFLAVIDDSGKNLVASTYLGGRQDDYSRAIVVDDAGNIYIGGYTYSSKSSDFPIKNALFGPHTMTYDAFLSKFEPSGRDLVFSTYLGGSMGDRIAALCVDGNDQVYMTGYTFADDFPTTAGAVQREFGGNLLSDAFITGLSGDGQALVASTYLGGGRDDMGYGITVGNDGTIWITGGTMSADFPVFHPWKTTLDGSMDAFVAGLRPACDRLVFSSFLGGEGSERGLSIVQRKDGLMYITGMTDSADFPVTPSLNGTFHGDKDAFLTVLSVKGEHSRNRIWEVIAIPSLTTERISEPGSGSSVTVMKNPLVIPLGSLLKG